MKKVTKYQSIDCKLFHTPEECQAHENKLINQLGDTVDGVSASEDKIFINLTNSTLSYSYEFYSLSKGMLSRPLTDILGKVILSIVNEDDVTIVITFSDNYSLLIKLV